MAVPGLGEPVEIVRDRWGINHIYAETERDLFFAQGYAAARDRLFQFEVWRAQATGTAAELLGPSEIERDVGFRLFKYRGDMTLEMNHYHNRGRRDHSGLRGRRERLDCADRGRSVAVARRVRAAGIRPKPWTPEVVISRHQGLLGNIGAELNYGRGPWPSQAAKR